MMLTNKFLTTLAFCSLLAPPAAQSVSASEPAKTLLLGIVPQQSATRLARIWVPIIERLSKETGLTIRFATTKDIPSFERCLAKGAYELAYMNPYHYTVFNDIAGYQAFARQANKRLQGILVVRQESAANSLADLDGQDIAFPSPAAFGASVLPRAEMARQGIQFQAKYVKSHDSVYRAVASGIFAAGGGVRRTLNSIPDDIRVQLRIIYTTKAYTSHAFAAHSSMDHRAVELVAEAMLRIATAEPALLTPLGMSGFERAVDADWDDIRALGLTRKQTDISAEGGVTCRSD